MSYCVNCGVELADSEKCCPLCETEVINPKSPWTGAKNAVYSTKKETIPKSVDKHIVANLAAIILAIPIVVTSLCNVVEQNAVPWSLYVLGTAVVIFVTFFLPMYFKRLVVRVFIPIDFVFAFLFLWLIETIQKGDWAISVALPICFSACMFTLLFISLLQNARRISLLMRCAVAIFAAGIYCVLIEFILDAHIFEAFSMTWSQYVLIPCGVLALSFIILDSQKGIKEALRKRMFLQ